MKKHSCLMAVAAVIFFAGGVGAREMPEFRLASGPWLQHTTPTTQAVMWETRGECSSEVAYGTDTPLTGNVTSDEKVKIHELVITGLEPETKYFYQVRSSCSGGTKIESRIYTFQTAVKKDSAFAFVVMGDNRTFPRRFRKIADLAYAERPNLVIHVGDVVTDGNIKRQWTREYLHPAAQLMARVPTYVSIGNHERNADWYYKYVSYPEPENYYSFDYGNAHFVMIDSNEKLDPGSKQYQWIEQDLAATDATWIFAAHHHPLYSSDLDDYGDTRKTLSTLGDEKVRRLEPLYAKYGVDVVWYGHIHDYERTWPLKGGSIDPENGVIYIQSGGGGAPLEDFAPTRSWYTAKVFRGFQYCYVTVNGDTLRMMAYDIDGNMYDYLELKK